MKLVNTNRTVTDCESRLYIYFPLRVKYKNRFMNVKKKS
jgi:hypothetical protein